MKMLLNNNSTLDELKYMLNKLRAKDEVNTIMVVAMCLLMAVITAVAVFIIISKVKCMKKYTMCGCDEDDFYFDDDEDEECCCCGEGVATDEDFEKE